MTQFYDMITGWIAYVLSSMSMQIVFYVLLFIFMVRIIKHLNHVVDDEENNLDWSQFISSTGRDGVVRADITKLGQVAGIILVFFITVSLSAKVDTLDWVGFCAVLTLALSYLAGVQAFQAYLKAKSGGTETTTVTESQPETRTIEVKSETAK